MANNKTFNKVFGIGLPKTGTLSLNKGLNDLGLRSLHFGDPKMGIYRFETLVNYDALTNACENYFPQVDKTYPGSKFIYTVRDKDSWLASIKAHMQRAVERIGINALTSIHTHMGIFGTYLFNEDRFSFVYDEHSSLVQRYFFDRPADILKFDISELKNLDCISNFLGLDKSGIEVPKINCRPL